MGDQGTMRAWMRDRYTIRVSVMITHREPNVQKSSRIIPKKRQKSWSDPVLLQNDCDFKTFVRLAKVPSLNFKTLVTFLNAETIRRGKS